MRRDVVQLLSPPISIVLRSCTAAAAAAARTYTTPDPAGYSNCTASAQSTRQNGRNRTN